MEYAVERSISKLSAIAHLLEDEAGNDSGGDFGGEGLLGIAVIIQDTVKELKPLLENIKFG